MVRPATVTAVIPAMDVSIVVLNYRSRALVRQCLRGVLVAQPRCRYEVIVVDNDSGDGCLAMVAEQFPWVVRVQSRTNRGFGAGNDLGIARARGRYVMILNPDIALFPGQIDDLVSFMDAHPRAGVAGPRLLYPDGAAQESCRRFPSFLMPVYRRTVLGHLPGPRRQLERFLMNDFDHAEHRMVDWLMGACLIARRDVLEQLGGFDEKFFLYFEDLDLCRRCWDAGWQVWYVASASPVHYHQRLSAGDGVSALFKPAAWQHLRSAVRYYRKYASMPLPAASPSGLDSRRPPA